MNVQANSRAIIRLELSQFAQRDIAKAVDVMDYTWQANVPTFDDTLPCQQLSYECKFDIAASGTASLDLPTMVLTGGTPAYIVQHTKDPNAAISNPVDGMEMLLVHVASGQVNNIRFTDSGGTLAGLKLTGPFAAGDVALLYGKSFASAGTIAKLKVDSGPGGTVNVYIIGKKLLGPVAPAITDFIQKQPGVSDSFRVTFSHAGQTDASKADSYEVHLTADGSPLGLVATGTRTQTFIDFNSGQGAHTMITVQLKAVRNGIAGVLSDFSEEIEQL